MINNSIMQYLDNAIIELDFNYTILDMFFADEAQNKHINYFLNKKINDIYPIEYSVYLINLLLESEHNQISRGEIIYNNGKITKHIQIRIIKFQNKFLLMFRASRTEINEKLS
ncbi:hypothetical protein [Abyssisolibacter fermentans]|uniref:hypothetical protein n=1 Tax=Abyssisolibacter fermentans TaxID=1766203 RepID=UPI0008336C57|nr:hypothetical protein [Abyssisolibacter fermentans]